MSRNILVRTHTKGKGLEVVSEVNGMSLKRLELLEKNLDDLVDSRLEFTDEVHTIGLGHQPTLLSMNLRISLTGQVERTMALDDRISRSLDEELRVGGTVDLLVGGGVGDASGQNVSFNKRDSSTRNSTRKGCRLHFIRRNTHGGPVFGVHAHEVAVPQRVSRVNGIPGAGELEHHRTREFCQRMEVTLIDHIGNQPSGQEQPG